MHEWLPISTSSKGRLALAAVEIFGRRTFEEVTVGELAAAADVTTGALYHHFGSKLGLYAFVRQDVERRLLDRMEGAIAASEGVSAALLVGFDFAVREGFLHILGPPPEDFESGQLTRLLSASTDGASPVLGRLLTAAWREALAAVADGADPQEARAALAAFEFHFRDLPA